MNVATFYADANVSALPAQVQRKAAGFDWRNAIDALERSVKKFLGSDLIIYTDAHTPWDRDVVRVGDARTESIILWLLDAQAAAFREMRGDCVLVSPDTLITGPLDTLFGSWDICLLTRPRPKAIVNSVIAARPTKRLGSLWTRIAQDARKLSPDARAWGADLDAVIDALRIQPSEKTVRSVDGVTVRFRPIDGIFRSVDQKGAVEPYREVVWDFKGARKLLMPAYAQMLLAQEAAA